MSITRRKFLKTAFITAIAARFFNFGILKENRLKNIKRPLDMKNLKKARFYKKL
jgi:hypothetical protein